MDEQQQGGVSDYSGRPIVGYADEQYTLKDSDGNEIGDIVEVNPDFIIVESSGGFLGLGEQRTYYVPRSAISREEGTDWYANVRKDDLDTMGWTDAPSGSSYAQQDYASYGDEGVATQTASVDTTDVQPTPRREGTRLVRHEEELQATTTARQAGEVEIRKDVVEEQRTIDVPVTREEVRVERRPASGDTTGSDQAFTGDSITVPVMEEEVQVSKVARPVEEIEVSKERVTDTQTVSDTVRREEIDVPGEGQLDERSGRS
jgi:uncharacterized protein (TIGR02271 family)